MVQRAPESEPQNLSPRLQALVDAIQKAEPGKERVAISQTIDTLFSQSGDKKQHSFAV